LSLSQQSGAVNQAAPLRVPNLSPWRYLWLYASGAVPEQAWWSGPVSGAPDLTLAAGQWQLVDAGAVDSWTLWLEGTGQWTTDVEPIASKVGSVGPIGVGAGQSGTAVLTSGIEIPQVVNSSYRTTQYQAVYQETIPLYTLTNSLEVVVLPPDSAECPVGAFVTVVIVGGSSGNEFANVTQPAGDGADIQVGISGVLEQTAVVTITYSLAPTDGGLPCFWVGLFGPPGPLIPSNMLPSPPTAGWVNMQPSGVPVSHGYAPSAGTPYVPAATGIWYQMLAANPIREGLILFANWTSPATVLIGINGRVYTVVLGPGDCWEAPQPIPAGAVWAIWTAIPSGSLAYTVGLLVTEIT
jgi:hypothetical protein